MAIRKINKTFVEVTNERLGMNSQLQLYDIMEDTKTKKKFGNIFKAYSVRDDINESLIYEPYLVEADDGWENIAFEFYGDVHVGGTIPLINNIVNPFEFPEPGEQIFLLKPIHLNKLLDEVYIIGDV